MTATTASRPRLILAADIAADLMTPNPVSIRETATVQEAAALLTDKGISAAPVINEAGYPIGVLSRTDLLIHDRERGQYMAPVASGDSREKPRGGQQTVSADRTLVRESMTPVVFAVNPETASGRVIEEMLAMNVHQLFVVDNLGVLVGVITPMDILRHLRGERG